MSPADVEELTDDQQDKQNGLKQQGQDALEDGKTDVALEKFTEAIAVGCASAMLYAKRASCCSNWTAQRQLSMIAMLHSLSTQTLLRP